MEFVNNAAFLVFIVFFKWILKKGEEPAVAFSRPRAHVGVDRTKKTQLPVCLLSHVAVESRCGSDRRPEALEAGPDRPASDRTLVFCAVLSHRSLPPHR